MEFKFEDTNDHSAEEQEALFTALTEKALTDGHTEFEYIRNASEWWVIKKSESGLNKVIELYKHLTSQVYNIYCKQVLEGVLDSEILFAIRQYQECRVFYEKELETVRDMLSEYWAYVWSGHFADQWLFFRERESWHLWDHRGNDNGKQ